MRWTHAAPNSRLSAHRRPTSRRTPGDRRIPAIEQGAQCASALASVKLRTWLPILWLARSHSRRAAGASGILKLRFGGPHVPRVPHVPHVPHVPAWPRLAVPRAPPCTLRQTTGSPLPRGHTRPLRQHTLYPRAHLWRCCAAGLSVEHRSRRAGEWVLGTNALSRTCPEAAHNLHVCERGSGGPFPNGYLSRSRGLTPSLHLASS